jgi:hypothetical protein
LPCLKIRRYQKKKIIQFFLERLCNFLLIPSFPQSCSPVGSRPSGDNPVADGRVHLSLSRLTRHGCRSSLPPPPRRRRCRSRPPATARYPPPSLSSSPAHSLPDLNSFPAGVAEGVERQGDHPRRAAAEGLRGAPAP